VSSDPGSDASVRPEPSELMVRAVRAAAADAGVAGLAGRAGLVLVPRGTWPYRDPGRLVAGAVGADRARTLVAELGVLQTTLLARAAHAVRSGQVDVAVVCGAEGRDRHRRLEGEGTTPPYTDAVDEADEVLRPSDRIISGVEATAGLVSAASQYALIENARRAAEGLDLAAHQRQIAEMWSRFNEVATANPDAWFRQPMSADDIASPAGGNRWIAFPYRKWEVSQWNVDQGAAYIVCSAEAARAHGVPTDRWVFVHAVAESNHMVPVTERGDLHRSPGFELAGRAVAASGTAVDDVELLDLYSCFPVAVFVQAAELGLSLGRPLTLTGGMTFAGGPLNNYVLQSTAAMCDALRRGRGRVGLVSAISGLITKQGLAVLGTEPPPEGVQLVDVSDQAAECATEAVSGTAEGTGTVLTYTVTYDGDEPARGIVLTALGDGRGRALASTRDADTMAGMAQEEWVGRRVGLDGAGGFGGK